MASVLTMGHVIKTNSETEKIRAEKGYSADDIPVLESFSLFKNGKPVDDFKLSNDDYNIFLTWLAKGPAKPIPDVGIKVLCFYKQKLLTGIKDFGTTDGYRQKQKNLINTIDEMLKGGDDTQIPGAICAKGGAASNTKDKAAVDGECCDSIKDDIKTIKTFISGVHTGSKNASAGSVDDETKSNIEHIKSAVDKLPELIEKNNNKTSGDASGSGEDNSQEIIMALQQVAAIAQSTDEKTSHILEELAKAQLDIRAIMSKSSGSNTATGLLADYDDALARVEEAGRNAEEAANELARISADPKSTPAQIQAAAENAAKAKLEIEKNLAIAQYIYKLDAESSSSIPVLPPTTIIPKGGAQHGGKRNKKSPENNSKLQNAQSKLSNLNSAINAAWKKLRTSSPPGSGASTPTDPSSPGSNSAGPNISELKRQMAAKNAKIEELTLALINKKTNSSGLNLSEIKSQLKSTHSNIEQIRLGLEKPGRTNSSGLLEFKNQLQATNAKIEQIKSALEKTSRTNSSGVNIAYIKSKLNEKDSKIEELSTIISSYIQHSGDMVKALNEKISLIPASSEIREQLADILLQLQGLSHMDQSGQFAHSDAEFAKMKEEYTGEIRRLEELVEEKTVLYERSLREIEELRETIGERDRTIEQHEEQLALKDVRIVELEAELGRISGELERVRGELEECLRRPPPPPIDDSELRELREKVAALTSELSAKTALLVEERRERESKENDLLGTREQLRLAEKALSEKNYQYLDLKSRKDLLQQDFEAKIRVLTAENQNHTNKIEAIGRERAQLEAKIAKLESGSTDSNIEEIKVQLESALEALELEHQQTLLLQGRISGYESDLSSKKSQLEAEIEAKNLAQKQLGQITAAFNSSGNKVMQVESELSEITVRIEVLIESIAKEVAKQELNKQELAKQLTVLKETIGRHVQNIRGLQEQLAAEESSKSANELEIARLRSLVGARDAEIIELKGKIESYTTGISEDMEEVLYLKEMLVLTLSVIKDLQLQLGDPRLSRNAHGKKEMKVLELEKEKALLEGRIENISAELEEKNAQIQGLQGEKSKLEANIGRSNSNISGLKHDLLQSKTNISAAVISSSQQKETYEKLLEEKEAKYAELLSSSGTQGELIESLQAQLASALVTSAANASLLKDQRIRMEHILSQQSSIEGDIESSLATISSLNLQLEELERRHTTDISGRNARIKELEGLAAVPDEDSDINKLRASLLNQERTASAEKSALTAAVQEAELRIFRNKSQYAAILREHERIKKTVAEMEVERKAKDEEIARIAANLAAKTQENELNLDKIREKQELIESLQAGQSTQLEHLQQEYQTALGELQSSRQSATEAAGQISMLQGQLGLAQQGTQEAAEIQDKIRTLTQTQQEAEQRYREELERHTATKAELARKTAECKSSDGEIKIQLEQVIADLHRMQSTLVSKQQQIDSLLASKRASSGNIDQKIALKQREISQLQTTIQILQTQMASNESCARLSATYLSQIESMKLTITQLTQEKAGLRGSVQGQLNTRFNRNFPGLSQTKKNGTGATTKTTLKNTQPFPAPPQTQEQYSFNRFNRNFPGLSHMKKNGTGTNNQSDGQLTEKNFPGLVKLRNSAKAKQQTNGDAALRAYYNDPVQKYLSSPPLKHTPIQYKPVNTTGVDPALVAYYQNPAQKYLRSGGTRKNGKPWNGSSALTIVNRPKLRKGARLAKSKRNIYPL